MDATFPLLSPLCRTAMLQIYEKGGNDVTSEDFRSDPMFLRNQFRGDGVFKLPIIRRQEIDLKDVALIGYDHTKPTDSKNANRFVHFFLDDYKFEAIVLSPQFSAYYIMPYASQIYHTFRSRWCGAYFQSKGLTVIPTVYWGKPQSYWYCFDGIEAGCVVAVSTVGVRKEKDFFLQGYGEMLRRIKPKAILCYGAIFPEMQGNVIEVSYADSNHLNAHKKFWTTSLHSAFKQEVQAVQTTPRLAAGSLYVVKFGGLILSGYGGGRVPMGRRRGNMPGDHERQNKQSDDVVRDLGLNKDQAQELHRLIGGEGMGYQEILEFARQWFGK